MEKIITKFQTNEKALSVMSKVALFLIVAFSPMSILYGQIVDNTLLQKRGELNPEVEALISEVDLVSSSYINFTVGENFTYLAFEMKEEYVEYYIFLHKDGYDKHLRKISRSDSTLQKIFDSSLYEKDFITLDSEFYADGYEDLGHGSFAYFFLKKEGYVVGEAFLPWWIIPHPAPEYDYLFKSLLRGDKF